LRSKEKEMRNILLLPLALLLSGCIGMVDPKNNISWLQPTNAVVSSTAQKGVFDKVPELDGQPIPIALYSFTDKTGQRKPSNTQSLFSTAVTQGADAYVMKSLQEVGEGKWFRVVERVGIDSLIKERQLIRQMREQEKGEGAAPLPPLMVAGIILEGGIIDYNTNVKTGGAGIRYLGIGPNSQYIEDQVVVHFRLVSVQSGEVLTTVTVEKNLLSTSEGVTAFRYFNMGTNAFEFDGQQTSNEPGNYAIRSAIETGIVELIKSGERKKLWRFKQPQE
jgi:curli production assembly/transport component CsgG